MNNTLMKAAVYSRYGSPEVLTITQVAKPEPRENEVLIRIHATTVTSGDVRLRKADPFLIRFFSGLFTPKAPILGHELAGVIETVGDKVTRFKVGDRVFGSTGMRSGTHAEYICMPEDGAIAHTPDNLAHGEASTLAVGALTAQHFIQAAQLKQGEHILIHGASGSIGTAAVQLAKAMGARVTAVCSTANVELVQGLGADQVIDYKKNDFTKSTQRYDVIFSTVGRTSYSATKHLLTVKGRFVTSAAAGSDYWHMLTSKFFGSRQVIGGVSSGGASGIARIRELAGAGKLKAVIDRHFPLKSIVEAHRYVDQGHKRGNVVIDVAA
ncbi:MAG TPA: NAD(P)-dependent alcohol dehydrogenase [Flavobacteriales bacterium]|nr:NAD(P)-dependent alcohol dehydrogenase [Flavobacteriales bacterium]